MSTLSLVLFVHVTSAIAVFVGTAAARRGFHYLWPRRWV
jgi:hypothetical protein